MLAAPFGVAQSNPSNWPFKVWAKDAGDLAGVATTTDPACTGHASAECMYGPAMWCCDLDVYDCLCAME